MKSINDLRTHRLTLYGMVFPVLVSGCTQFGKQPVLETVPPHSVHDTATGPAPPVQSGPGWSSDAGPSFNSAASVPAAVNPGRPYIPAEPVRNEPAVVTISESPAHIDDFAEQADIQLAANRQILTCDPYLCQQLKECQALASQLHDENGVLQTRIVRLEERMLSLDREHRDKHAVATRRIDSLSQELNVCRKQQAALQLVMEQQQNRDLERLAEIADLVEMLVNAPDSPDFILNDPETSPRR